MKPKVITMICCGRKYKEDYRISLVMRIIQPYTTPRPRWIIAIHANIAFTGNWAHIMRQRIMAYLIE